MAGISNLFLNPKKRCPGIGLEVLGQAFKKQHEVEICCLGARAASIIIFANWIRIMQKKNGCQCTIWGLEFRGMGFGLRIHPKFGSECLHKPTAFSPRLGHQQQFRPSSV